MLLHVSAVSHRLVIAALFLAAGTTIQPSISLADCLGGGPCDDGLSDSVSDLRHSGSYSDAVKNARNVGSAVKDCATCLTNEASEAIGNFGSSNADSHK
jgi:hypothetical protein